MGGRGAAARVRASKHLDPLRRKTDALVEWQGKTNSLALLEISQLNVGKIMDVHA